MVYIFLITLYISVILVYFFLVESAVELYCIYIFYIAKMAIFIKP